MFERYTEKARRAVFFARYEASQFGSASIETEHLLLGLLREDKGLFLRIRLPLGAAETIRKDIETHTPSREKTPVSVDLPVSNDCKQAFAHAAEEAEQLNDKHIGTVHLLLGLLRQEKCFAARLLDNRNVSLKHVREAMREFDGQGQASAAGAPSAPVSPFSVGDLGADLCQQATDGLLPPLIGRGRELERTIQVLCRHTRGNPVLVGEAGVGRKTIVYGLAKRIAEGAAPSLDSRKIVSLDLAVIASGTKSRSRFEENLDSILQELFYEASSLILFIEGLHSLAQSPRFLSLASVIKPGLLDGRVQCISTATPAEYAKAIAGTPWLEQCFTVVDVKPATETEAVEVLTGSKERFEKFHMVLYDDEAIRYAVFHANNYLLDRSLPEKAIDLMDEAGARAKIRQKVFPDEVLELRRRIRSVEERHERALKYREFEKARAYADELKKERENLEEARKKYNLAESIATVTREDIEQVVAERTGVSVELLRKSKAGQTGHS